jgi:hypothetical protein
MIIKFTDGKLEVTKVTAKKEANFALIADYQGIPRVISVHSRRELANPAEVHNLNLTNVRIGARVK